MGFILDNHFTQADIEWQMLSQLCGTSRIFVGIDPVFIAYNQGIASEWWHYPVAFMIGAVAGGLLHKLLTRLLILVAVLGLPCQS